MQGGFGISWAKAVNEADGLVVRNTTFANISGAAISACVPRYGNIEVWNSSFVNARRPSSAAKSRLGWIKDCCLGEGTKE